MTEFMHEAVARREATLRRSLTGTTSDDFYSRLQSQLRQAYDDMMVRNYEHTMNERRESAIRAGVASNSDSVTYAVPFAPYTPVTEVEITPHMLTVIITDEMRQQYANV
jgi:hypothetical protein